MKKNKIRESRERSLDELVKLFDVGNTDELWEKGNPVEMKVSFKNRGRFIVLTPEIAQAVSSLARSRKTTSEKIVNQVLHENLKRSRNTKAA